MTPYGWEGNRRSGVALAMRHRLSGLPTYELKGLWKRDAHSDYTPLLQGAGACCSGKIWNNWSKNYDERPHRRDIFFTGSVKCDTDQSGALEPAATLALMQLLIFWLSTTHYWLPILFSGLDTPNIARSRGGSRLGLIHGSFGSAGISPQWTASRLVQSFCRAHERDRQTDRLTDHATP